MWNVGATGCGPFLGDGPVALTRERVAAANRPWSAKERDAEGKELAASPFLIPTPWRAAAKSWLQAFPGIPAGISTARLASPCGPPAGDATGTAMAVPHSGHRPLTLPVKS